MFKHANEKNINGGFITVFRDTVVKDKQILVILREKVVLNSLPNDKILDVTNLKVFAEDKFNVAKMTVSLFDRVENTVGNGENAGYQHFLLFPQCFPKPSKELKEKTRYAGIKCI